MGRGGSTTDGSAVLFGSSMSRGRRLGRVAVRRWAKAHPELFVLVLTELELETRLGQILEERAGAEHEEVLAGNAEIVPTSIYCYGKLLVFKYELSPLIDAEIEDVSEESLVLDAAELCDEEILDAVYEKVIELHRQDIIDLRS